VTAPVAIPSTTHVTGFGKALLGGGALVLLWVVITALSPNSARDEDRSRPASRSSALEVPPTPEASGSAVIKPGVGTDLRLSRAEVRWCLFQEARLEAARTTIKRRAQTAVFNELVQDYNLRCSEYQYRQSDLDQARLDTLNNEERLKQEGAELVRSAKPR
jgi:hypothetical protein